MAAKKRIHSHYIFILAFLLIIILSVFTIKAFSLPIITSVILAYLFYPLYRKIGSRLKMRNLSAAIVLLIILLIMTIPLYFSVNAIAREAKFNYLTFRSQLASGEILGEGCNQGSLICVLSDNIETFVAMPGVRFQLQNISEKATDYIINSVYGMIISLPSLMINLFVIVFLLFFFIRDGSEFYKKVRELSPLKKAHTKHVLQRIDNVFYAVVYGLFLIALVQGFLGGLGLFILGFSAPFMWGFIIAFLSLLPFVGPPLVWLPLALIRITQGYFAGESTFVLQGILLIVWGVVVLGSIDNILKPRLIGHKAKVHPVTVLLGVLGGLRVFGILGIIIGPLILATLVAFVQLYEEDKEIFIM